MTEIKQLSGTSRAHVLFDGKASADLARCMALEAQIIGSPVSRSCAVRRALALLAAHLDSIVTPAQVQAERAEMATVLR